MRVTVWWLYCFSAVFIKSAADYFLGTYGTPVIALHSSSAHLAATANKCSGLADFIWALHNYGEPKAGEVLLAC
jgi:hypothetical protein